MPKMKKPSLDTVFVMTMPNGYEVFSRPLLMTVNASGEWEIELPEGHMLTSSTNKWSMHGQYRPVDWVLQGASYYPLDSPERFPDATLTDTFDSYLKRVSSVNGVDLMTQEELQSVFEAKKALLSKTLKAAADSARTYNKVKSRAKRAQGK